MAEHLRNRGGHVFAFEPVAANFQRLTQNIAFNHLDDHVSAFNFGLGDQESQATISMENDGGATTGNAVLSLALLANDPKGTQSSIHIKRMDDIVDHLSIERADFIKVDIERAEIFFLRGARQFIEKHQPIIFGEFNSCFIERFGHSVLDANEQLTPLGYRAFLIGDSIHSVDRLEKGMQEIAFVPPGRIIA